MWYDLSNLYNHLADHDLGDDLSPSLAPAAIDANLASSSEGDLDPTPIIPPKPGKVSRRFSLPSCLF